MAVVSGGEAAGRTASWRRLVWVGPLAGVAAAAVNSVVYFVGAALGLVSEGVVIPNSGGPLTVGMVSVSTLVPALAAAVVFAVLGRFTGRPVRNFRVLAAVVLVLSVVTPFTIPGVPGGMIFVLLLMHVVAAVIITGVLTTLGRR